jgi:CRP/FNR family transcriptional regulator
VDQRSIGIKDIDSLRTLRRLPPSSSRSKAAGKRAREAAARAAGTEISKEWNPIAAV